MSEIWNVLNDVVERILKASVGSSGALVGTVSGIVDLTSEVRDNLG